MLYLVYGYLDTQCGSSLWLILSLSLATVGYYCTRRLTHAQKSILCLCATVLAPFGKFNHLESGKCQKGTNNASCWLCSHWRMLSQDGILTWTRSVFCFGNVQASTGYPALTAVMKIFFSFPGLLSFQCTSLLFFFLEVVPFYFYFALCFFSFVFPPHKYSVSLSLWYWDIYNDGTVSSTQRKHMNFTWPSFNSNNLSQKAVQFHFKMVECKSLWATAYAGPFGICFVVVTRL